MDINDCIIIDVRTREEFMGGHVAGSKNIPLLEILEHEEELKKMVKPIIFCCVSGARSGQAPIILNKKESTAKMEVILSVNFKVINHEFPSKNIWIKPKANYKELVNQGLL